MSGLDDILALPTPYYLFRLLTDSDHMHFGWFRTDDEAPGAAQENMMQLNLFFRPSRLQRVLDIGAGLGATARELSRHGAAVTAISPDAPLIAYAKRAAAQDRVPHAVDFQATGFEGFQWQEPFDWVLFQESFQYFPWLAETLAKAHAALRPGGRLHIGDQFLHVDLPREQARFHHLPRVLAEARRLGFVLRTQCDVTRAASCMTRSLLGALDRRGPGLIAAHAAKKPEIERDVADMLRCGRLELSAFDGGELSYQLLVFDRP
jgi:SAM-dependent methyltransferase